jgi:hypothetical protein
VLNDLQELKVVRKALATKRLGAGTGFAGTPISCIALDLTSTFLNEDMNLNEIVNSIGDSNEKSSNVVKIA